MIKASVRLFRLDLEKSRYGCIEVAGMYISSRYRHYTRSELVLGQVWFVIHHCPLTEIMFMFVFGDCAGIPTDRLPNRCFIWRGLLLELFLGVFFRNTFNIIRMYLKKYIPKTIHVIHDKMGIQFNRFVDGQRICWFAGQFGVQINAMLDAMQ